jgi:hypothetical protein
LARSISLTTDLGVRGSTPLGRANLFSALLADPQFRVTSSKHLAIIKSYLITETIPFRLDDEQRNLLRDCLRMANSELVEPLEKFVGRIEASINVFRRADPEGSYRDAHDKLRALWRLSRDPDPSVGLIRSRLRELPPLALRHIERRACRVISQLFPGDACENGFLLWAAAARPDRLVRTVQSLSYDGGA